MNAEEVTIKIKVSEDVDRVMIVTQKFEWDGRVCVHNTADVARKIIARNINKDEWLIVEAKHYEEGIITQEKEQSATNTRLT